MQTYVRNAWGFMEKKACQEVCPVDCCIPDEDNRETEEELLVKAKKIHTDQEFPELADLTEKTSLFHNPNRKKCQSVIGLVFFKGCF